MNEDQRRARPGRDQLGGDHRLAAPRRRTQHPELVPQHVLRGLRLRRIELSGEMRVEVHTLGPFIGELQPDPETPEQLLHLLTATARQRQEVPGLLKAGDHPWRARGGEPQALELEELRVREAARRRSASWSTGGSSARLT